MTKRVTKLVELREELGFYSARSFCAAMDLHYGAYGNLEGGRLAPRTEHGPWTQLARSTGAAHGVALEAIWPAHSLDAMERATVHSQETVTNIIERGAVEPTAVCLPISIDEVACLNDLRQTLDRLLVTLGPREEFAVRQRFKWSGEPPRTFAELGAQFGVSGSRARVIFQKAMRMLRHSSRSKQLLPWVDFVKGQQGDAEWLLAYRRDCASRRDRAMAQSYRERSDTLPRRTCLRRTPPPPRLAEITLTQQTELERRLGQAAHMRRRNLRLEQAAFDAHVPRDPSYGTEWWNPVCPCRVCTFIAQGPSYKLVPPPPLI